MQSIIAAVALALLFWMASTLNTMQQSSVRQEERMVTMQAALNNQDADISRNTDDLSKLKLQVDRLERTQ